MAQGAQSNGLSQPVYMTDDAGLTVSAVGATIATGQVNVGTGSTLVVTARAGRKSVTISQTNAVASTYTVGNNGVTATTGVYVASGGVITLNTSAAIYAASATASTLSYVEVF